MSETAPDSVVPEAIEPLEESGRRVVSKALTTSEQLQKYEEAIELLPVTPQGAEAMFNIQSLIDEVHRSKYNDVPYLIGVIQKIFRSWNINLL